MTDNQNEDPGFKIQVVPVTALQQNASIIWATESMEAAIVDPGGDFEVLTAAVDELGVKVVAIWLTHGHIDHIGAATALKNHYGCPIIGPHEDDEFLLSSAQQQGMRFGINDAQDVEPDQYLNEGDTIELSGIKFDVYHCPGHSPGHVIFHQPAAKFAYVGDVLFRGSIGADRSSGRKPRATHSIGRYKVMAIRRPGTVSAWPWFGIDLCTRTNR